jgi:hypothetical protein
LPFHECRQRRRNLPAPLDSTQDAIQRHPGPRRSVTDRASRGWWVVLAALLSVTIGASTAPAMTSHDGWPSIDGMVLMNKRDQSRPLDARAGHDPFDGRDPRYRCDGLRPSQSCFPDNARCRGRRGHGSCREWTVKPTAHHNELLGGGGNDVVHAGPNGDVIWGDYKPGSQPTSQHDQLFGGDGSDYIYTSHGRNEVQAGAGNDSIKAHFGRGSIDCGPGTDTLYVSRRAQKHYAITGCEHISHRTAGS